MLTEWLERKDALQVDDSPLPLSLVTVFGDGRGSLDFQQGL